jgi:hypothetical protein
MGPRPFVGLDRVWVLNCARATLTDAKSKRAASPRCAVPPPPEPRAGPSALAGERSEPVRLGARGHTRSIGAQSPAQSEQWCCWVCRHRILSGPAENGCYLSDALNDQGQCAAVRLNLASAPELHIRNVAAPVRTVSAGEFSASLGKVVKTSQIHGSGTHFRVRVLPAPASVVSVGVVRNR